MAMKKEDKIRLVAELFMTAVLFLWIIAFLWSTQNSVLPPVPRHREGRIVLYPSQPDKSAGNKKTRGERVFDFQIEFRTLP